IDQIQAFNYWNYYQAKGIKASLLASKVELLEALGKPSFPADRQKLDEYKKEQEGLKTQAEKETASSDNHLKRHIFFAQSATIFQIAITVGAISTLTKRKRFWYLSLCIGFCGLLLLLRGFL